METVLTDKLMYPDEKVIKQVLGSSFNLYSKFREKLYNQYPGLEVEWKFYGAKSGWTMKCLMKKRNLFFFTPYPNLFRLAFVFGDKAVQQITEGGFQKKLVDELLNSKKYAEGRGLRIDIRSEAGIEEALKLISIKIGK